MKTTLVTIFYDYIISCFPTDKCVIEVRQSTTSLDYLIKLIVMNKTNNKSNKINTK
jgi:hypothetical protein